MAFSVGLILHPGCADYIYTAHRHPEVPLHPLAIPPMSHLHQNQWIPTFLAIL